MSYELNDFIINRNLSASLLTVHEVPALKFWVMENPKTLVDRYAVVFDMPSDPIQEGVLPAICMNRIGHLFHDEVEKQWLLDILKSYVTHRNEDSYHIIGFDELPAACKKALGREIASLLIGDNMGNEPALRKFTVVLSSDSRFECFAENEMHAAEQAINAYPTDEVKKVLLANYVDF